MVANQATYTLPSTIARIKEMYVTPVGGLASGPILMTTLDEILTRRRALGGATLGGYITHYALLGSNDLEMYPTPASADVVTIYYVGLPTALSSGTDVPVIQEPWASKLLEYGALAEAADWKGDPSEQEYRQLFEVWKQKYRGHLTRKMGAQPGQFNFFPSRPFRPHDPSTDLGF